MSSPDKGMTEACSAGRHAVKVLLFSEMLEQSTSGQPADLPCRGWEVSEKKTADCACPCHPQKREERR